MCALNLECGERDPLKGRRQDAYISVYSPLSHQRLSGSGLKIFKKKDINKILHLTNLPHGRRKSSPPLANVFVIRVTSIVSLCI